MVRPFDLGHTTVYNAVSMIQSNFGDKGNLELVARADDDLAFFWRDSEPEYTWNGPTIIAMGVSGCPSMIQSSYGQRGTFEVVTPMASGGACPITGGITMIRPYPGTALTSLAPGWGEWRR